MQKIKLTKVMFEGIRFVKRKLLICLTKIPFLLLALFIKKYLPDLKFGYIVAHRIGHFIGDIDVALVRLLKSERRVRCLSLILVTEKEVCNEYGLSLIKGVSLDGLRVFVIRGYVPQLFINFIKNHELFLDLYIKTYDLAFHLDEVIKYPSILVPKPEHKASTINWLKAQSNINPSNPFIFIHNRDDAYLPRLNYHSFRDFRPNIFFKIIQSYGMHYNFIRGGKTAREALPSNLEGCIDLPFTCRSEAVDILAHNHSLFYFGSDSGIHCVSTAFRKPIAFVNFSATSYGFIRILNHLRLGFIPKKLEDKKTRKRIGLIEMYERKLINLWEARQYEEANIRVLDNTEEEVFEFFHDALTMYNDNFSRTLIETSEQEEFWRIVTHYEPESKGKGLISDNSFIGARYLTHNRYLLTS